MLAKLIVILLITLFAAIPATASVNVEGVQFSREVKVDDKRLTLNGYGLLRYMVFIKAYVGALYLPETAQSTDALSPVAKRLELEYFHAIKGEDFAKATRKKIKDNIGPDQTAELQEKIDQLAGLYQDIRPGDRYALTYVPGQGTELALNGQPLGTIAGDEFSKAVFSIWLGSNPIDKGFRDK